MVDFDAAVGFIVARGDAVERARLSYLRTGARPPEEILQHAERGQTPAGGWPAQWGGDVASIDATCFRLAELDDLGGLVRPAAARALGWLARRQRYDGFWEEDTSLAGSAPPYAQPGDPEARFYLTVNAAFWLAIAAADSAAATADSERTADSGAEATADPARLSAFGAAGGTGAGAVSGTRAGAGYEVALERAAQAILGSVSENGTWPGYLVSGWLAGAVLHRTGWFYEAARILVVLQERVPTMSAADTAWMVAALRRAAVAPDDALFVAARQRLSATQRPDGAWPSDDAPAFDVHATLTALRALR
jgi:hypothetical protein